jgi:hypothetical protein
MADPVQRLESGRTQLAGVSSLPQPNMNFGQQRPELEFQAQADASTNLSRVLSNLSNSMFGQAERLADAAGAEFVAQNPVSAKQLAAMSQGDAGKFKQDFSLNAFSAATQKFRANELSANAEIELIKKVNEMQQRIDLGRDKDGKAYEVSTSRIVKDFTAMTNGWSSSLAQVSSDASYKYRATAATHANRLITAAAKKESQLALTKNKVKIAADVDDQYTNTITAIIKAGNVYSEKDQRYLTINELIAAERDALISRALPLGGADAAQYALERSDAIEKSIKVGILEEAVISRRSDIGGDLVTLTTLIKDRRLPADLQNVWDSLSVPQQKEARDKMVGQYQQLIDNKSKTREFDKQDRVTEANSLTLEYLNPNTDDTRRAAIISSLEEISLMYPEVVSAKSIRIDLPTLLKKEVEDNFVNVAKLEDLLRGKEPTLRTTESILAWATANGIKPTTAIEIAGRYLPKELKAQDAMVKALDVEFLIRTKTIDPLTKRAIRTPEDARRSYEVRGMTLGDAPDNLGALLAAKPEEGDDDPAAVAALVDQIDNGIITSATTVAVAAKGKRIKGDTVISLGKRVGERRLQLELSAGRVGGVVSDLSGSSSAETKARIKLEASEATRQQHDSMVKEWVDGGQKGPIPSIEDAGRIVTKRFADQREQKQIDNTKASLDSNFGVDGSMLPDSVKKSGINIIAIEPKFKPGSVVQVTDNYRKHLIDSLMAKGASQVQAESISKQIIQQQIFIEQTNRRRSAR